MGLFMEWVQTVPAAYRLPAKEDMLLDVADNSDLPTNQDTPGDALYRHTKREEWGLAIIAWERPDMRGYQFEDGQLRVFKKGYYELLAPVDSGGVREAVIEELKLKAGRVQADSEARARNKKKTTNLTFADQLTIFRAEYPRGFADESWLFSVRGEGARRLKRHRDPAIAAVKAGLSAEELAKIKGEGGAEAVVKQALTLMSKTTLTRPRELEALRDLTGEAAEKYARGLEQLIHGELPMERRFDAFVMAHPEKPSWPMATTLLALYAPATHLCVHPSTIRRQADVLGVAVTPGTRPRGKTYARLLDLVGRVEEKLVAAGQQPADKVDLFDFMRITLAPSAKRLLVS